MTAADRDGARDMQRLLDALVIRKHRAYLNRAVALGIIDHGQRCALFQLRLTEIAETRARDALAALADDDAE
jgi:hypothetical protein